ncbi:MAG: hypothetical protein II547_09620, partial [Treponema sp.]|nr:hypothetical protein [Treponema sp.]
IRRIGGGRLRIAEQWRELATGTPESRLYVFVQGTLVFAPVNRSEVVRKHPLYKKTVGKKKLFYGTFHAIIKSAYGKFHQHQKSKSIFINA